jgi:hypothetical protein
LFSLPRNGSEWNSESLRLFLFHGTEFRAFYSLWEWFVTEFREFFVPRSSQKSAGTNQMFRLFRFPRINFLPEIANQRRSAHRFWVFLSVKGGCVHPHRADKIPWLLYGRRKCKNPKPHPPKTYVL